MINERCFALTRDCRCRALEIENCPGYKQCVFYKPGWKQNRDQMYIDGKLRALSEARQRYISEKYYHGDMPWAKEYE